MPTPTPMPTPPDRVTRALGRVAARPALALAIALAAGGIATGLALRLQLRPSLVELLPTRDPAVVDLARTSRRVGDLNLLLVGIRSPDRAANLRFAAALTAHLRALPRSVCDIAAYDVRDFRDFVQRNRWLYASEAELTEARDRLRAELIRHENPFAIAPLLDDEPPAFSTARADELERRFPGGMFVSGDYAWVVALPPGGLLGESAGQGLLRAVRAFVAANPPAAFHPEMRVMPAGPVMSALENREAIERDVVSVTVACVVIISLAMAFYFRSLRALPLVTLPALLGTALAFAAAALSFGYLNSSTAFLGSIILGNGINPAIVLLSRYRERRGAVGDPLAAATRAVEETWRGTLAAALAASAAYASLTLTTFRGFSQFGLMGAVGSLGCWLATFLVLPASLVLADGARDHFRWRPRGRAGARGDRRRAAAAPARQPRQLAAFACLVGRRPRLVVVAAAVLALGAVAGLRHFAGGPFEYDFRKLTTDLERDQQYRQFDSNMDGLFGHWHTPQVVLADRLDQVEAIRRAIRARDVARPGRPYIGQVVTVYDLLPGPPDAQARKLALLREIRALGTKPAVRALPPARRRELEENLPPADLRELQPEDLPPLARRPFTEVDGTVGRPVLVYHAEKRVSMWNGHDLLGIADVLRTLTLSDGTVLKSSGAPMIFGAMLRSVLRDGPLATALSLAGVLLVAGLALRPLASAATAVGAMLLGVLWMLGAAGLGGVRITFLNFVALPITFGVGIEYAVNIASRLAREPDPACAVRSTGGAVALCSFTTIVGYGSLLAARSRALRGFGEMAILGEVACLLAAVLVLPAAVAAWRARRGPAAAHREVDETREADETPGRPGRQEFSGMGI
jgi:predicted RND superfamily exporter protein